MRDYPSLLDALLEDQAVQSGRYKNGPYWEPYAERIVDRIRERGLASFRSDPVICMGYGDAIKPIELERYVKRGAPDAVRKAVRYVDGTTVGRSLARKAGQRSYARRAAAFSRKAGPWLDREYPAGVGIPTTLHGCKRIVQTPKNRISEKYLRSLIWIDQYHQRKEASGVETMLEIGGGLGAYTHAFISFRKGTRVIYVDTPPVLYVATQYLKSVVPSQVVDYLSMKKLQPRELKNEFKRKNNEGMIWCIPPWELDKFRGIGIDHAFNASSFQEMTEDQRDYYYTFIKENSKDGAVHHFFIYDTNGSDALESQMKSFFCFDTLRDSRLDLAGTSYLCWSC